MGTDAFESHLAKISRTLLSEDEIQERVAQLGEEISRDYAGRSLHLITVLKGGAIFLADLMRHLSVPVTVDFMAISSYGGLSTATGVVRLVKDLDDPIEDRDVLIVEDITDTGLTMNYLLKSIVPRKPASLKICTLLDRPYRRIVDIPLEYVGFDIPDVFVVGYGLDYNGIYRNLKYIGVLEMGEITWDASQSLPIRYE